MIPRRLWANGYPRIYQRRFSGKVPPEDPPENKKKPDDGARSRAAGPEIKDKLKSLLQSMIDDKSKLEADRKKFESKVSFTDVGFRKPKVEVLTPQQAEEKKIADAAKDVAASFGEEAEKAEAEIMSKILDPPKRVDLDWKQFLSGMVVDTASDEDRSNARANEVKQHLGNRKFPRRMATRESEAFGPGVFDGTPLGIFSKTATPARTEAVELKTWDYFRQKDLQLAISHPPRNYFEQMILWTNQGKIWKFPIDNEQGLEKENEVHFSEHIFLENHLENWCPDKGPIRHFMELVCVGLSKNAYVPLSEKRDHLDWFREYFVSKKDTLIASGAWPKEEKATV